MSKAGKLTVTNGGQLKLKCRSLLIGVGITELTMVPTKSASLENEGWGDNGRGSEAEAALGEG